ncbi:MAG: TIGR04283 family arsenosugar biosynthesis glycosyltransferase [Sulfuriflexus sp.]|nr:TIGR04283 family arsenosugar biosynthesis glycosyltransferase [Sulfuriflexus sp.]
MIVCSIIIPVLNESAHLPTQLAELQAWRQAGHEIIVVDGGSEDASGELARPLVDQLISSPKGRATQMNKGAASANNEWLVFLHADTLFSKTAMNSLQNIFHREDIKWGRFDVRLSGSNPLFRLISILMNIRSRISGIATGDQAMFMRKAVFDQVGGFPDIALMEDISLSSKLKKMSSPYCMKEFVTTSSRRWHKHGIVKTIFMMWSLRLRYFFGASPRALAERYNRSPK